MTTLRKHAEDYLVIRRALGYKLADNERLLTQFLDHLQRSGLSTITTEAAVAWATLPVRAKPIYWRRRLSVVRGFARHVNALDPACQVPPSGLLPCFTNRAAPHLYSQQEVLALLAAADRMSRQPLRAATYRVLIGLLAVTGMRTGEAVRLNRDHLDLDAGVLSVLDSKYGKSRQVLLHASTVIALRDYADLREHAVGGLGAPAFFVSAKGRLIVNTVDYTLRPPGQRRWYRNRSRRTCAAAAWSTTHLRGDHPAAVVSRGPGRPGPAADTFHLARSSVTGLHLLVSAGRARTARTGRRATRQPRPLRSGRSPVMAALAPILEAFFTDRLMTQRRASPHTISAYRDTFRLLLTFAHARTGKTPVALDLADLDTPLITALLQHLEAARGNSVSTRNTRLAAIHSLFSYAALRAPEHAGLIQRVLAIPPKRYSRTELCSLTAEETTALLAAPDHTTWTGRRDHALLRVLAQTGLHVSELTALRCRDVELGAGAHLRCTGKGRKNRSTPLTIATVRVLREWMAERAGHDADSLFCTRRGGPLSPDAVEHLVAKHAANAAQTCRTLASKNLTPHTLRHSHVICSASTL